MNNDLELSAALIRDKLASIDLSDIDSIRKRMDAMSPGEEDSIAVEASKFYRDGFEDELKLFIQLQLEFIAKNATSTEQLQFSRGTFNGLCLIRDWFERQKIIAIPDKKEKESQQNYPTGL